MLKINYVNLKLFAPSLRVAATPQKFIRDKFSTNCHNSRMTCPRKLILDSNEAE